MILKHLQFTNKDATPKVAEFIISADAIPSVMAWYGAYYASDRYKVIVNGIEVEIDQNGELVGELP